MTFWLAGLEWLQAPQLGWLAAAAIPLWIFLRRRFHPQTIAWGAMPFVRQAAAGRTVRRSISTWMLIALRMLLVAVMATAVAGPVWRTRSGPDSGSAPAFRTLHVLVLDDSLSMSFTPRDTALVDQARKVLLEAIDGAPPHDAFVVLSMAGRQAELVGKPTYDRDAVRDVLRAARAGYAAADVPRTLRAIRDSLERAALEGEFDRAAVLIATDLAEPTWDEATASGRVRESLEQIARRAALRVVRVGPGARPNIAVSDCRPVPAVVTAGQSAMLAVELRAYQLNEPRDVEIQAVAGGRVVARRTVRVADSLPAKTSIDLPPLEVGNQPVSVQVEADGLRGDNQRWAIVKVRPSVRLLIVESAPGESRPLQNALQTAPGDDVITVEYSVVAAERLAQTRWAAYDVIAWWNPGAWNPSAMETVEAMSAAGKNMLLVLGDRADAASLSAAAAVLNAAGRPAQTVRVTQPGQYWFDPASIEHPLWGAIDEPARGELARIPHGRYVQLNAEEWDADAALRFETGHPAILVRRSGTGQLVVWATGAVRLEDSGSAPEAEVRQKRDETPWSSMIASPMFVPLINETVQWMVGQSRAAPQWTSGVEEEIPVADGAPDGAAAGTIRMVAPTQRNISLAEVELPIGSSEERWRIDEPGLYEWDAGRPGAGQRGAVRWAVNVDPREGNLTPVADSSLLEWPAPPVQRLASNESVEGSPLYAWLLPVAAGLLLLETFMAWLLTVTPARRKPHR